MWKYHIEKIFKQSWKNIIVFDTLEYALPLEAYYSHTPLLESCGYRTSSDLPLGV